MKGWYITSDGLKCEFISTTGIITVSSMNITELVIPDGVKEVFCYDNQLIKLDIPDSVTYISCKRNSLTELIIPDHCGVYRDESCKVITRTMFNRSNRLKSILDI
jgi:hypothetical protein